MSLAWAALREGSIGVTITIFEVPGGGLPAGLDEEGELKMYQRKVKTAKPLARYGSNDRRLRRRCVDERGVYGCGCEVLRGYGNCIIVNAVGGVVECAGFVVSFYEASLVQVVARCFVSRCRIRVQGSIASRKADALVAYKLVRVVIPLLFSPLRLLVFPYPPTIVRGSAEGLRQVSRKINGVLVAISERRDASPFSLS